MPVSQLQQYESRTACTQGHRSGHGANGFHFTGRRQRPHRLQSMRCPCPRRRGSSNGSAAVPGSRRACHAAAAMLSSWEEHVPAAPGAAAAGTGGEALEPSPWLPSPPRSWPAGSAGVPSPRRHGQGWTVSRSPTDRGWTVFHLPSTPGTRKPFDLHPTAEIKQGRPSTSETLTGPSA